jgi:tetratricopeptide (TPR) repeat protein
MNRAERRRQDKRQSAGKPPLSPSLQPLVQEAVAHHRAGRLAEAEALYQEVLARDPRHPDANHLLGLLAYRSGRLDRAVDLLSQATQSDPKHPTYWFNLGVVLQKQGKWDDALSAYRQALSRHPAYPEAHSNIGNVFMERGKPAEAEAAYREALRIRPEYVEAQNNLGVALKDQGRFLEAEEAYRRALALAPSHVEAHGNLGAVLLDQGRVDDATASLEHALRLKPEYLKAVYHLGFAFLRRGHFERATDLFRRSAGIKYGHARTPAQQGATRARLKHEAEQARYLLERGLIGPQHGRYVDALEALNDRVTERENEASRIRFEPGDYALIAPSFETILHYADAPALPAGAINPALDVPEIERRYHAMHPEVMHIDHLLTDAALTSLRTFCLESTIWKRDYDNGYLGAFLGDGFSCPLLLQIAEELRGRFPRIFGSHPLTQAWAFKYDSERIGLNIHADAAAVNVNFWITPDEANLNPSSGGLIVWDKEAPKDWSFREYNSTKQEPKVREFLEKSGARPVTIPYRANRAVVFNSDLFHETDRFQFKDQYASRRINVTLLYGRRSEA